MIADIYYACVYFIKYLLEEVIFLKISLRDHTEFYLSYIQIFLLI